MRKLVAFAAGVVALASLGIAAGASTTPPTGTLSCGTTGTVTFKPALTPTTPAKKPTSVKIHKAAVAKLFESNDQVLDAEQVYSIGETV